VKIQQAHYDHMVTEINTAVTRIGPDRVASFKTHVSPKRYRWDLLRAANLIPYVCSTLYPYMKDEHIDTALRHIVADPSNKL
jgi:hypothetical protein